MSILMDGGESCLNHSARNAWRAVYTVHFQEVIYVLHVFQKKIHKRDRDANEGDRID